MYAQAYSPSTLRDNTVAVAHATSGDEGRSADPTVNSNNGPPKNRHVAMDFTPGLVFHGHNVALSILCVSPWAKVVVLLRNPVDRAYQQWVYSRTKLGLKLSLEDWMAQEMKLLQSTGLVSTTTATPSGADTAESSTTTAVSEREAWFRYKAARNAGVIGRGMYVLQLQEWIDAYLEAGRVPAEEMIILVSEDVEKDPVQKYNQLVDFLGLAPYPVGATASGNGAGVVGGPSNLGIKPSAPKGVAPMAAKTRKILQQIFQPYNRRLATLLRSNGFAGDWDHLWKL